LRIPAKTRKPCRARRRLVANPIPELVPVTTAISILGLLISRLAYGLISKDSTLLGITSADRTSGQGLPGLRGWTDIGSAGLP
jgi:hypothetical protein